MDIVSLMRVIPNMQAHETISDDRYYSKTVEDMAAIESRGDHGGHDHGGHDGDHDGGHHGGHRKSFGTIFVTETDVHLADDKYYSKKVEDVAST